MLDQGGPIVSSLGAISRSVSRVNNKPLIAVIIKKVLYADAKAPSMYSCQQSHVVKNTESAMRCGA